MPEQRDRNGVIFVVCDYHRCEVTLTYMTSTDRAPHCRCRPTTELLAPVRVVVLSNPDAKVHGDARVCRPIRRHEMPNKGSVKHCLRATSELPSNENLFQGGSKKLPENSDCAGNSA